MVDERTQSRTPSTSSAASASIPSMRCSARSASCSGRICGASRTARSAAAACGSAGSIPCCAANPFLRPDPSGAVRPTNRFPLLTLAEGVAIRQTCASASSAMRARRAPPISISWRRASGASCRDGIRFQVCLPTPFAVVSSVVVDDALPPVEAAYERAMMAEVAALCPPHPASGSLHPMGRVQRDGDLGRPDDRVRCRTPMCRVRRCWRACAAVR